MSFTRKRLETLKREEEQFLKDDDTARMQQGAVPEAPEITISEWQSKPSARRMPKYGSTGDEIVDTQRPVKVTNYLTPHAQSKHGEVVWILGVTLNGSFDKIM